VDDVKLPDVSDSMDHFAYDETSFLLAEVFALPEKHAQVEPVAVVH
jgi:hypothetical protein